MDSECLNCRKAYNAIPENKKRKAEYDAEYNANPENKKRKAEYDAKYRAEYYAIPENKKRHAESKAEWKRKNRDKVAKYDAKREAVKRNLPNESIENLSFEKCELTGDTSNVHIEHSVPLSWGHGGTTLENCYPLEGSLNSSKRDRNPFEWYENTGKYSGVKPELWNAHIEERAKLNGITAQEYRDFVYWCEANKRTIEQIKADNKRYGYIVDSVTLWRDSMANMATREIA